MSPSRARRGQRLQHRERWRRSSEWNSCRRRNHGLAPTARPAISPFPPLAETRPLHLSCSALLPSRPARSRAVGEATRRRPPLPASRKVTLKDPLARWIPDFPRGNEITVGHLARHSAGIPHRVTEDWEETVPHTAADMVEFARKKPLEFAPGERSGYSSAGFSVLARVLELASGNPYAALLEEVVCAPAGMTQSLQADSRQLLQGRASCSLPGAHGTPVNAPLKDMSFLVGAGSVYSTTRDLQALLRAVRQGVFGEGVKQSYVDDDGIDWNGSSNGFRAFADWHPGTDLTVVFTGNLVTGAIDRLRRDVPRHHASHGRAPRRRAPRQRLAPRSHRRAPLLLAPGFRLRRGRRGRSRAAAPTRLGHRRRDLRLPAGPEPVAPQRRTESQDSPACPPSGTPGRGLPDLVFPPVSMIQLNQLHGIR